MNHILLQRIRKHDKKAFKILYDQYFNRAIGVAALIIGNDAAASEAVQETFIQVYNHLDQYSSDFPFEHWFYKILIIECQAMIKMRSKVSYMDSKRQPDLAANHSANDIFDQNDQLYNAVGALNNLYKIPIALKYLKGFQDFEIAEILEINIDTLQSHLNIGKQKLAKIIEHYPERRSEDGTGKL